VKTVSFAILTLCLLTGGVARAATFEIEPSLDIGKPAGEGSDKFTLGLGVGVFAGGRLNQYISVGGQVDYQSLGVDNPDGTTDVSAHMLRFQVGPVFHFVQGPLDFGVGPTFGLFFLKASGRIVGEQISESITGYQLGLSGSLLYAVSSSVSLGPTFGYARMWATEICDTVASQEDCTVDTGNGTHGFWSVGFAARF
jgi:hypothetical protein